MAQVARKEEPRQGTELGEIPGCVPGVPTRTRTHRSHQSLMKLLTRGTVCLNWARTDLWGASSGFGQAALSRNLLDLRIQLAYLREKWEEVLRLWRKIVEWYADRLWGYIHKAYAQRELGMPGRIGDAGVCE